jgi:hypothetical protein
VGAGAGQAVLEAERDATSTIFLGDAVRAAKEGGGWGPPELPAVGRSVVVLPVGRSP